MSADDDGVRNDGAPDGADHWESQVDCPCGFTANGGSAITKALYAMHLAKGCTRPPLWADSRVNVTARLAIGAVGIVAVAEIVQRCL